MAQGGGHDLWLARARRPMQLNLAITDRDELITLGSDFIFGELFWRAARCIPLAVFLGRTIPDYMKLHLAGVMGSFFSKMTKSCRTKKHGNIFNAFSYTDTKKEYDLAKAIVTMRTNNAWSAHVWEPGETTVESQIDYMAICFQLMNNGGYMRQGNGMTEREWIRLLNIETLWLPTHCQRYWYGFWDHMEYMYHWGLNTILEGINWDPLPNSNDNTFDWGDAIQNNIFRRLYDDHDEYLPGNIPYDLNDFATWTKRRPLQTMYLDKIESYPGDNMNNHFERFLQFIEEQGTSRDILEQFLLNTTREHEDQDWATECTDPHSLFETNNSIDTQIWFRSGRGRKDINGDAIGNMHNGLDEYAASLWAYFCEDDREEIPRFHSHCPDNMITLEELNNPVSPIYNEWCDRGTMGGSLPGYDNDTQHDVIFTGCNLNRHHLNQLRRNCAHCCGRSAGFNESDGSSFSTCYRGGTLEAAHTAVDYRAQIVSAIQLVMSHWASDTSSVKQLYNDWEDGDFWVQIDHNGTEARRNITWRHIFYELVYRVMDKWNNSPNMYHLLGKMHEFIDQDDTAREMCMMPGLFEHIANHGYVQPERLTYPAPPDRCTTVIAQANVIFFALYGGNNPMMRYFTPHPRNKITEIKGKILGEHVDLWNWMRQNRITIEQVAEAMIIYLFNQIPHYDVNTTPDVLLRDIGQQFIDRINELMVLRPPTARQTEEERRNLHSGTILKQWELISRVNATHINEDGLGLDGTNRWPFADALEAGTYVLFYARNDITDYWEPLQQLMVTSGNARDEDEAYDYIIQHHFTQAYNDNPIPAVLNDQRRLSKLDKKIPKNIDDIDATRDIILGIIRSRMRLNPNYGKPVHRGPSDDSNKWHRYPEIYDRVIQMIKPYLNDARNGWRQIDDAGISSNQFRRRFGLQTFNRRIVKNYFMQLGHGDDDDDRWDRAVMNFWYNGDVRQSNWQNSEDWIANDCHYFRVYWSYAHNGRVERASVQQQVYWDQMATRYEFEPQTREFDRANMQDLSTFFLPFYKAGKTYEITQSQMYNILRQQNSRDVDDLFAPVNNDFSVRSWFRDFPGNRPALNIYELVQAHSCYQTWDYLRRETYIPPAGASDPWRSSRYLYYYPSKKDWNYGGNAGLNAHRAILDRFPVYTPRHPILPPRGIEYTLSGLMSCASNESIIGGGVGSEVHRIIVLINISMIGARYNNAQIRTMNQGTMVENIFGGVPYPARLALEPANNEANTRLIASYVRSDIFKRKPVQWDQGCVYPPISEYSRGAQAPRSSYMKITCQARSIVYWLRHLSADTTGYGFSVNIFNSHQTEMDLAVVIPLQLDDELYETIIGDGGTLAIALEGDDTYGNSVINAARDVENEIPIDERNNTFYSFSQNDLLQAWILMRHDYNADGAYDTSYTGERSNADEILPNNPWDYTEAVDLVSSDEELLLKKLSLKF